MKFAIQARSELFRRATMLMPSRFSGFELGVIICRAAARSELFRRATMLMPSELSGFELGVIICRAAPVETRAALETLELFANTKKTVVAGSVNNPGNARSSIFAGTFTSSDQHRSFPSYPNIFGMLATRARCIATHRKFAGAHRQAFDRIRSTARATSRR